MQIRQETVEKILYYLIDAIEEKQLKIDSLNSVVAELADDNVARAEQIVIMMNKLREFEK